MGVAVNRPHLFFPGFWKVVLSGADWAFSENLKYKMYAKWYQAQVVPTPRIDRFSVLYQGLAAFSVLFEMGFIVAVLFRKCRAYAVASGFAFHAGVAYFMRIVFSTLMWCYVVFLPWGRVFRRAGRWMFDGKRLVRYNSAGTVMGRLMAVVHWGDWFHSLEYRPDSDLSPGMDLAVADQGEIITGWRAFGRVLSRVPLVWPLTPMLAIFFAARSQNAWGLRSGNRGERSTLGRAVWLVGGGLFVVNLFFGLFLVNSWPFSVYPTHAGTSGPYITDTELLVTTMAKDTLSADDVLGLSRSRRRGLAREILAAPDSADRDSMLRQVSSVLRNNIPASLEARDVHVYRLTISKVPEQWENNPVERTLILTIPLTPRHQSTEDRDADPYR